MGLHKPCFYPVNCSQVHSAQRETAGLGEEEDRFLPVSSLSACLLESPLQWFFPEESAKPPRGLYSNIISTRSSLATLFEIATSPPTHCQLPFSALFFLISTHYQRTFYISLFICVLYACLFHKVSVTETRICLLCSWWCPPHLEKWQMLNKYLLDECTAKKILFPPREEERYSLTKD